MWTVINVCVSCGNVTPPAPLHSGKTDVESVIVFGGHKCQIQVSSVWGRDICSGRSTSRKTTPSIFLISYNSFSFPSKAKPDSRGGLVLFFGGVRTASRLEKGTCEWKISVWKNPPCLGKAEGKLFYEIGADWTVIETTVRRPRVNEERVNFFITFKHAGKSEVQESTTTLHKLSQSILLHWVVPPGWAPG